MKMGWSLRWLRLLVLVFVVCPVAQSADDVRVMSFNIRYGSARDGENVWENRKQFVVDTIEAFAPDLLGTQETLKFQRDYLAERLPAYECVGVGRDDGQDKGEMMAVYYRRDRFEKLEAGHFWLSETPGIVGSRSWDSSLPRMVTWLRLRDRRQPDARPIMFLNTHFDHRGRTARRESATLLRQRALQYVADSRVILTGDFNAAVDSPPYQALFGERDSQQSPLVDSYAAMHAASETEGTFSGFQASSVKGSRIDWIAVSRDWEIRTASIDRTARDGRTPSDHFPVTAVLTPAE